MRTELTIKQEDFYRLINREDFLGEYFNVRLRYRIPTVDNGHFYIEVLSDDETIGEHAEQYIRSFLEPKHTRSISSPSQSIGNSIDEQLFNRIMKEYVVHIDVEDKDQFHQIIFQSLSLTVLYMAIDDFLQSTSDLVNSNPSMFRNGEQVLALLSSRVERELSIVENLDQFDDDPTGKSSKIDDHDESNLFFSTREAPPLKIAHPGVVPQAREVNIAEVLVKPPKKNSSNGPKKKRGRPPSTSSPATATATTTAEDDNDNELAQEIRQKLKGKELRDVIIDGANIGRTYGESEFSSRGIQLAVDHFHSFGYPDSKIVVIVPAHYLSKDHDGVFPELIRRKILHKNFHQKIEDKLKRFYDDRLIIDLAVMRKGIILSNDFYRDISKDAGDAVKRAITERLLCYRFIGDNLCLPNPVSEGGLPLDKFLSK